MSSSKSQLDPTALARVKEARESGVIAGYVSDLRTFIHTELLVPADGQELLLDAALHIDRKAAVLKALDQVRAELAVVRRPLG